MRWAEWCLSLAVVAGFGRCAVAGGDRIDLTRAVVVVRPGQLEPAERMASSILVDEVAKRTGLRLAARTTWPDAGPSVIALSTRGGVSSWSGRVPRRKGDGLPETKAEGFAIRVARDAKDAGRAIVFVVGADGRGVMFGVGRLLRELGLGKGSIGLDAEFEVATSPAYPIRGHQLGYRSRANSYDAWTPRQYEQYIRELIIFGANCIENIPFQGRADSRHMPVSRREMNVKLGEICAKYDIDHWVWTPAEFSLKDGKLRQAALDEFETFYKACPRLDAVFFPGGDPGDNPPDLVVPFLEDMHKRLVKHHPKAGVWVSLQGFDKKKTDAFHAELERRKPTWLAGVVAGPSSPSIPDTRVRLPKRYGLRWYPDITHCVLCQFERHYWDPAFAMTLGREPVNPTPREYARIFRFWAPHTDGFLSYSDGIHDDVNKAVWSQLGWDPDASVRRTLIQYARFFFGSDDVELAADAILGLENNWSGSLVENGAVRGVLRMWRALEESDPEMKGDWRRCPGKWRLNMHLFRAHYDAYTRARLLHETALEDEVMSVLSRAGEIGADKAMAQALAVLGSDKSEPFRAKWLTEIWEMARGLFKSIGYQTSVKQFGASGYERGAVMDLINRPLNNRWWLEDEFAKIGKMGPESEKLARLAVIAAWENPGPGSFYDDIGNVGKSPHVVQTEGANTDPEQLRHDSFSHSWWEGGSSRRRISWHHHMRWPAGMAYEAVDPGRSYTIRLTGNGVPRLRADGVLLEPSKMSKEIGEFKEYPVPGKLCADGKLKITFDPIDESHLNWRQHSHLAEIWLLAD